MLTAFPMAADVSIDQLEFTLNEGGESYSVSKKAGQVLEGGLVIPAEFDGKPVTSIGSLAFFGCGELTSVEIPTTINSIDSWAFQSCYNLAGIYIPSSVISIGLNICVGCNNLSSIVVDPANPAYDSRDNCNAIIHTATNELIAGNQNTTIPMSVTTIGESAFADCFRYLTSIRIPSSVTSIGTGAFSHCYGLTGIEIPSSVTSIGRSAFFACGLTSIQIPSSVTFIGEGAFSANDYIEDITVDSSNPVYDSRDGCNAIIHTATNVLTSGCKNTNIPASVTSIGNSAFSGIGYLTSIEIPMSVTSIGDSAFNGCRRLVTIEIPSAVTSIGIAAFYQCESLTTIIFKSETPPSCAMACFDGCNSDMTFYVPAHLVAVYRDKWLYTDIQALTEIILTKNIVNAGEVYGGGLAVPGQTIFLNAVATDGYTFDGWYIGEDLISTESEYEYAVGEGVVTFEGRFSPISGSHEKIDVRIVDGRVVIQIESIENAKVYEIFIYDASGKLVAFIKTEVTLYPQVNQARVPCRRLLSVTDVLDPDGSYTYDIKAYDDNRNLLSHFVGDVSHDSTTDIDAIASETTADMDVYEIYDIRGRKMVDSINMLSSGTYIMCGGGKVCKIVVR